jgi:RNA polymerase sigma-70 factor (ECF subfamily)
MHSYPSSENPPSRAFVRESFDREYLEHLKARDAETERHFIAYFGELLRIKLRARLRSCELIEDARQETFLRVLTAVRRKGGLEHPERLGAFVNSVCQNVLYELYRSDSRARSNVADHPDIAEDQDSTESALVTEESRRQVREVIRDLPAKDRDVLRMVFYDEIDRDEICRRFGVDREYLRVLVHRAKSRFREGLLERQACRPVCTLSRVSG